MRPHLPILAALTLAAACGGDDGGTPAVDAPTSSVQRVDCATSTPTVTVTAPGFAFSPAASTITAGQVVQFMMPATHNAVSDSGLFRVEFNTSACFKFTSAGTFGFHCEPHLFTGSITVQ